MKRMLGYVKPYAIKMTLQFMVKFGGTIIELLLPWMLSVILDDFVPISSMRNIYLWGFGMIVCSVAALALNIAANRIATMISRDITMKIRHDLFEKISYLSSETTDKFTVPSLISRLTSDTYNVHLVIDRMQRLGVRAPILLIGGIAVTLILEPVLTLALIGVLPLLSLVVYIVSKKGIPLYTKTQTALDDLVRKVQENMSGARVIKALSKGEYEKKCFDEKNLDVIKYEQQAGNLMAITNPVMNLLLNIGLTLVIIVGAFRVNMGVTQPGTIIAFMTYFAIILNALMMVSRLFVVYSKGVASSKRIAEVLDAPCGMDVHQNECKSTENHIEFNNVSFSYNEVLENLSDVTFAVKRGERIGIIGPTGSGKSTIISLLLRFRDVDKGEIRISGERIDSITPEILHTKFGVVFQNDFLFSDTIRSNIDFGRSLNDEKIKSAVGFAKADFVYEKSGGLDSILSERGNNLSGGQKQRILIARALCADPEILILDDSQSALDYKTDAEIRHALKKNFNRTTTILVAQRVSSIIDADKIIILDDGKIIGYGTHKELLKSCKDYREICELQMGEMG